MITTDRLSAFDRVLTTVPFKGDTTWTIKLKPGRYTYQCDVHASVGMKGHFKVTA